MAKVKLSDLKADYVCMAEAVKAFEKLSRHHSTVYDSDSVARNQGVQARMRVLSWLTHYIQEHPYL